MCEILKRCVAVYFSLVLFSVCFFNSNSVEAKANIVFTTTSVILEKGKCTIKGYFKNNGDTGAYVKNVHFVVDVTTKNTNVNIWSDAWNHSPDNCYIPAGSQKSWEFWRKDENCPRYSSDNMHWSVKNDTQWGN